MSFPCVLGMQDVKWEDGAYHSNGGTAPSLGARSANGGGSKTPQSGFEISGKSNGEVASYLFQRQGVATSFSKTVAEKEDSFGGQRWSSADEGMDELGKDSSEMEGKFQSLSLNNNEKKSDTPIEEIATTAKKLWDVQDSEEESKGMSKGILLGEQWREQTWGPSVPHVTQSEHAISQPIMVQRSGKSGVYSTNPDSQGVLSPRSADGVGLSMVEYVLASSPGGQELDGKFIKPEFDSPPNNLKDAKTTTQSKNTEGSPFEEETATELSDSRQREPDMNSPKPLQQQPVEEERPTATFSRTPGSRQPSPTASTQQTQDVQQSRQPTPPEPPPGHNKPRPVVQQLPQQDHIQRVALIDPLDQGVPFEQLGFDPTIQPIIGTPTSPSDYIMVSAASMHGNTHNSQSVHLSHQQQQHQQQLALAVAAQQQQQQQQQHQQQQQQQQQLGLQQAAMAGANPYYLAAAATQDPYGNPSMAAVNPGGAVVHPQYAAYNIQPWGMYQATGASSAGTYLQQQQQQQQQQQAQQLLRTGNAGLSGRPMQGQMDMMSSATAQQSGMAQGASQANYQLIAPPGSAPLGIPPGTTTAYYDQSGNLVLGNAQGVNNLSSTQQLAGQMGAPLRMVSPLLVNSNNTGANSVGGTRLGGGSSASAMRMYGQQAQQQQAGHGSIASYPINQASAMQLNSNPLGMLGNSLGVIGGSSGLGTVGAMSGGGASRRESAGALDYGKRQALPQYYTTPGAMSNSFGSLSISAQPSYNAQQELPTPPLLSQGGQSAFHVGSPIASSSLSRYMQFSAAQNERKYPTSLSSVGASPYGSSGMAQTAGYHPSRSKDPNRSRLLEDFRNNRYPSIQLRDLVNHIVEFSQDQHGSRFIQQKLERASATEKHMVFNEILPNAYNLMTDVFGNYVIQKFFEFGSQEQKQMLAERIRGHVLPLALQMYGCRVIQKALECIPLNSPVRNDLVKELDGHVLKCVRDQNGNHVVQKCIECVEPASLQFIINAFKGQVFSLSTHPYGCRVIQRILEHCMQEQTSPILAELLEHTERLVQDQYGNYVIQHVLEHGTAEDKGKIVMELRGKALVLSQHKFASNVVEKCVTHANRQERAILIDEVCNSNEGALYTMMKDQFANYVVQKMIDVAEPGQRKLLMLRIRPHVATLRKYTYGKHILAKLEKYYMAPKPAVDFLPLTNGQLM